MTLNLNDRPATREECIAAGVLVRAVTARLRDAMMHEPRPQDKEWEALLREVFDHREPEIPYSLVQRITEVCERMLAQ